MGFIMLYSDGGVVYLRVPREASENVVNIGIAQERSDRVVKVIPIHKGLTNA